MKKLTFIFFISLSSFTIAQNNALHLAQDTLNTICKKLYSAKTDADKDTYNAQLLSTFERALSLPDAYNFNFDSLKRDIGLLRSPDNSFRIINWNVPKVDGTQMYYGFIQEKYIQVVKKGFMRKQRNEIIQLYPLTDKSAETRNPENAITDNKKWFGMLYYKIILKKYKKKTYYTLLAWDGNDKISTKKIIDALTFDNTGIPHFGADIFVVQKKYPKRIIFEYSPTCTMSLRYSEKKDSIVFDHLAPTSPQLEGQYQYYCNDGSYDGFGFKKGKWNYGMYLNAVNDKDDKDKMYNDPHNVAPTKESTQFEKKKKRKKK